MNKEKQIEEMAKAIYNLDHCEGYKDDRGCMYAPTCSVCKYGRENKAKQISELLAKQGYRKASEVAREIFKDCHNTLIKILNTVRDGLDKAIREDNEEAKLVHIGTEETVKCIILVFSELKKKYTESEKNNGN